MDQKDRVVHFEIAVSDMERAKKFYESIFDWKFVSWGAGPVDYYIIQTGPTDEEGMPNENGFINGGMFVHPKAKTISKTQNIENAYVCTVSVENIDETLKKVKDTGGKVVMDKKEIPGIGISARCLDLDGNIFGLLQPSQI